MSARILLVEDDPVSQDLLRSVLQAHGYTVDAVGDGFTGLRLLKQQAYALALAGGGHRRPARLDGALRR